jgi:hypothetical protein
MNWYWFPVPANLTKFHLTLGPGTAQVLASYPLRQATVQLNTPTSLSFALPGPVGTHGGIGARHRRKQDPAASPRGAGSWLLLWLARRPSSLLRAVGAGRTGHCTQSRPNFGACPRRLYE